MHGTSRIATMALGFLLATAASLEARDLCIRKFTVASPLVAKNFKVPAKNKCAAFGGFASGGIYFLTGSACTNPSGSQFSVQVVGIRAGTPPVGELNGFTYFCVLSLPLSSASGTCTGTGIFAASNDNEILPSGVEPATASTCSVNVP